MIELTVRPALLLNERVKFLLDDASKVPFAGVGPCRIKGSLTLTWIVTGNFIVTTALARIADVTAKRAIATVRIFVDLNMRRRLVHSMDG